MKKFLEFILYVTTISLLFVSCKDYLEPILVPGTFTEEEVMKEYNYSKRRVASIYSDIPSGFSRIDGAMLASASDEAEHTLETSSVHHFNRGSWNQFLNPDDVWSECYRGIREINQFLVSSDSINFDLYKYDPKQQDVYQTYLSEVNRWKYEVRFLRAYFYFELIKRYGGVPLITTAINEDFENIQRNSLDDCIRFIVNECDSAAKVLPVRYGSSETGRVTKVAALALKSRILLYGASELFNNSSWAGGYAHSELISLNGDRQTRWRLAANAAKGVIDVAKANGYNLAVNYKEPFGTNTHNNVEVIFFRREGNSNSFEKANLSVGFDLGKSGTTPSQNLVDAYEMLNGKPISDTESGYNPQNPYAYRDPRLQMTIVTNNSLLKGRAIECWEGGLDGPPIRQASKTGYYLKKYVNENLNLVSDEKSTHSWIIFRLAEFYLNYAEALNEFEPENTEIKTSVDQVRQRVNMPPLPEGLTQDQMRQRIYNERRVEFAFEEHRLWDVRRWMIAASELSKPLKGVKISKDIYGNFNYTVTEVESRNFLPKMYFYPIPQNEIYIDKNLIQNPLW